MKPRSAARTASSATRRVLPTPASPLISACAGWPAAASSSRPSRRRSSPSLPTSRSWGACSTCQVSQDYRTFMDRGSLGITQGGPPVVHRQRGKGRSRMQNVSGGHAGSGAAGRHDDDPAVSYQGAVPGTPVLSRAGNEIGTLEHVLEVAELDLFDGIVIATDWGLRFIDADQVEVITIRHVRCRIDDA